MSDETDTEPSAPVKALRTVTPYYRGREDSEMDTFGWAMFLALVILLVPLLPFVVIVWLLSKVLDALAGRRA